MAPFEQYLMPDRNEEIKMARSAAPDSISADAEVLVLGQVMAMKPQFKERTVSYAW